ncbi:Cell division initiation protein DivIVA [Leuconostoc pseudomesenteroides 4882]|nr:Cell division initiation protein DivIVA [Leuconostoc pseudomesenteroides 4882]
MALSPDEILNHEFTKKGSKAYVATEVDAFWIKSIVIMKR